MMQERERPRFTLFSQADADAMNLRERSSSAAPSAATTATTGASLPPPAPKYFPPPASAHSYTLRPSQTFYGGRESFNGGDTDASVASSSVADGSSGSSQQQNQHQHKKGGSSNSSPAGGRVSAASASAVLAPNGSRVRASVCVDASNTFEDMFETDWEGYLWKQGHVVRSWRFRFAVLSGTTFTYYVNKEVAMVDTEKFRGRVTVTGARLDESRANGVLVTTTINKVFALYTRSQVESEIWVRMIQQAVANASDQKPSMSVSTTTRTSGGGNGASSRDSDWQMLGNRSTLSTNAILAQSVRSSYDWKTRNLSTIKQFYALWTAQLLEPRGQHDAAANLIALFPLCSTDMVLSVRYPCEFIPSAAFYGREGLVDVALGLARVLQFRRFSVSRYLSTKHPHILQVMATGKVWNKALQREFAFNTRDELQLSPGGRVLSMQMQIEVDLTAFTLSDSERKAVKSDRVFQGTTSKRVLSLSIQHFHVNRVLGKGTFGTVVLAERKNTGEIFAVKILEKSSMSNYDKLRTKTEMRILRDVHHPFIAPLRFSFQSNSRVFLGMDYYPGGSLYTHMNRFTNNKENRIKISIDLARVRFYASQIVLALCHLHACDIVYRYVWCLLSRLVACLNEHSQCSCV